MMEVDWRDGGRVEPPNDGTRTNGAEGQIGGNTVVTPVASCDCLVASLLSDVL